MFDRFTERSRRVIQLAKEEAQRLNHEYIGTEHLLLGLVKEGSGVAANVLKRLDVDLRKIRTEIEKLVLAGPDLATSNQQLPYTPRAKRCIEFSFEESKELGQNYIGTEHILLGLLRENEGIAAQVLKNLGLELQKVRDEALSFLDKEMPPKKGDETSEQEPPQEEVRTLLAERLERSKERASRGEERILREKQIIFWREFSQLISSGVPILETLDVIAAEIQHNKLAIVAKEMRKDISNGGVPSDTLERYPAIFSKSAVALIKAGEAAGLLDKMAARLADGLEQGTIPIGTTGGPVNGVEVKPPAKASTSAEEADEIIKEALKLRASDIHIELLNKDVGRVRFRIDGVLREKKRMDRRLYDRLIPRVKVMANLDAAERRLPQDGRILINTEDGEFDLRVCACPSVYGESVVMRILPKSDVLLKLDPTGLSDENLRTIRDWMKRPNGVIVLTGPTGCGKTTVIYAMLNEVNSEGIKVITAEDPVEHNLEGVIQIQTDEKVGITFARALRSILRQDPDVVMLGEIRDLETAEIIVQTALTGHLVITTLHTAEAASVFRRLADIGLESFLINDTVIGATSQRLVRMICPECKEAYTPTELELKRISVQSDAQFYKGQGCDNCSSTGYRGRTGIFELVELNDALRKAIAESASAKQLRQIAIESGMKTMREDGIRKAMDGITTLEEIFRVTQVSC